MTFITPLNFRRYCVTTSGWKTTNPKPFDSGSLRSACKEFPNFCRLMSLLVRYVATITTVFLRALLAIACSVLRSAFDFTAANVVGSPAICACAKK